MIEPTISLQTRELLLVDEARDNIFAALILARTLKNKKHEKILSRTFKHLDLVVKAICAEK